MLFSGGGMPSFSKAHVRLSGHQLRANFKMQLAKQHLEQNERTQEATGATSVLRNGSETMHQKSSSVKSLPGIIQEVDHNKISSSLI